MASPNRQKNTSGPFGNPRTQGSRAGPFPDPRLFLGVPTRRPTSVLVAPQAWVEGGASSAAPPLRPSAAASVQAIPFLRVIIFIHDPRPAAAAISASSPTTKCCCPFTSSARCRSPRCRHFYLGAPPPSWSTTRRLSSSLANVREFPPRHLLLVPVSL
jgi:hypothetical protein